MLTTAAAFEVAIGVVGGQDADLDDAGAAGLLQPAHHPGAGQAEPSGQRSWGRDSVKPCAFSAEIQAVGELRSADRQADGHSVVEYRFHSERTPAMPRICSDLPSRFPTFLVRQARSAAVLRVVLGGLALAAVAGTPVASAAPRDAAQDGASVSIADFAFGPADVTAPVGTSVTWTNAQAGVPHTTSSLDGVWDSGTLSSDGTFSFEFDQLGDFAYQCNIHPSMKGVVHVVAAAPAAESAPAPAAAAPATAALEQAPTAAEPATAAVEPAPSTAQPVASTDSGASVAAARVVPAPTATPAAGYGY
jgi:plastocyanin